ncbi:MAG TPA: hypothetical protein VGL35_06175 [Rhizomicrobium sp.]|jgi:hypothetical protein
MLNSRPLAIVPLSVGSPVAQARQYRHRAEELRAIAGDLCSQDCQAMLERLANSYDEMADRADRRAAGASARDAIW